MIKKILLFLLFSSFAQAGTVEEHIEKLASEVYSMASLDGVIDYALLKQGVEAYMTKGTGANPNLVIIDFRRPSNEKRFYVVDLADKTLKYHTYTTHGIESGGAYAERFSNTVNSKQTSLGVFKTAETYYGKYGYSLRLDGLSEGINDNARRRYIVIHGANYASPDFLASNNFIGWSWGCPALPPEKNREIIDLIKGGSIILAANEEMIRQDSSPSLLASNTYHEPVESDNRIVISR
ncbi:murein L,D-transpeptidase catalytic domain family protein [Photobacterium sp. ZSDE20]|uniref:Murein L,D-transpeptidase catalytic domain family protein n=1 Tax=Photobacterium pectinilyticum TaxID=2906793 RepID=A0ABT1N474_9GAMM|nr:murein L,D-transpeptidase catalytic domain family protein [Photobacterium sp. ZSDE20]MCQ1058044.1 murein L,D-transpeptidase catalytic domain family protein [Photobacterium sp. ZSDE20]MDD1822577.1 murein L,D-transpeptidase catalytic domain family protein [Photobacterium sp. ZSDE20]